MDPHFVALTRNFSTGHGKISQPMIWSLKNQLLETRRK